MPTLTARLVGTTTASTRNRVAILHPTLGFATLTMTDPAVDHSNMGRNWVELARQDQAPYLLSSGQLLPQIVLRATVAGVNRYDSGSVVATLALLQKMAEDHTPVVVGYGSLEAGSWQIVAYSYASTLREPTNDEIVQADVTLTLKQAAPVAVVPGAAPKPTPPKPIQFLTTEQRRVTVAAGDTLFTISNKVYGTVDGWTKLAAANGITDPRALTVGQILTVP